MVPVLMIPDDRRSGRDAPHRQAPPGVLGWSVRRGAGGLVVRVSGELDMSTSAALRRRLTEVVESGRAEVVVLDLSEVGFLDAQCAGLLVSAWAAARRRGRRLVVDGLHGVPATVLDLLGLREMLAPEDT